MSTMEVLKVRLRILAHGSQLVSSQYTKMGKRLARSTETIATMRVVTYSLSLATPLEVSVSV